jgi:hypothetical protein
MSEKIPYSQDMIDAAKKAQELRANIVATVRNILSGGTSFIEGARSIALDSYDAMLDHDPDIMPFIGVASETDALPIGKERQLWNADALVKLQPEIDRLESWARDFAMPHCHNLIRRFG